MLLSRRELLQLLDGGVALHCLHAPTHGEFAPWGVVVALEQWRVIVEDSGMRSLALEGMRVLSASAVNGTATSTVSESGRELGRTVRGTVGRVGPIIGAAMFIVIMNCGGEEVALVVKAYMHLHALFSALCGDIQRQLIVRGVKRCKLFRNTRHQCVGYSLATSSSIEVVKVNGEMGHCCTLDCFSSATAEACGADRTKPLCFKGTIGEYCGNGVYLLKSESMPEHWIDAPFGDTRKVLLLTIHLSWSARCLPRALKKGTKLRLQHVHCIAHSFGRESSVFGADSVVLACCPCTSVTIESFGRAHDRSQDPRRSPLYWIAHRVSGNSKTLSALAFRAYLWYTKGHSVHYLLTECRLIMHCM